MLADYFVFSFVLRVMCGVLGLIVVQHDLNRESSGSPVLVSNYTTPFDHVAVELARPNVMVGYL